MVRFGVHPLSWTPHLLEKGACPAMPKRAPYPPEFRQQMVELLRAGRSP